MAITRKASDRAQLKRLDTMRDKVPSNQPFNVRPCPNKKRAGIKAGIVVNAIHVNAEV